MGVIRIPATAPIAAAIAKDRPTAARVSMPTRRAAISFAAVATIALPIKVRSMKAHSSTRIMTAPASTTRLCGRMAAPAMRIASPPTNGGRVWKRLSNITCAAPRRKIEAPMVMMMSTTAPLPRAGSFRRFHEDHQAVIGVATESGDRLAGLLLISLGVGNDNRLLRVIIGKLLCHEQRRGRQPHAVGGGTGELDELLRSHPVALIKRQRNSQLPVIAGDDCRALAEARIDHRLHAR